MDFSMPAWLGALLGAIVAVAVYVPAIRRIEQHLRAEASPQTREERVAFEGKLSVTRRVILGADIAILATAGYWIGTALGKRWAG
jgi:hypothetical protein